ncbi:hypothetical protein, partial [Leptospira bouyouniensis]|uniref:hypothetical protein n=1 Tax=Leptospira bouyouniensis TaxID=2484911 RepID=UPI001438526C
QGSYSIGHGVQLAGDVTTNGAANIGLNYNPTGEGPRRDWNFSLMYDMAGTGLSASVGYTNPNSTIGLTSTVNRDGLSTSAELTGVSIATNGPDGFQMDEINFAEQNINAAQDQTQNDQNKAKLLASGDFTPADIANMSDDDIQNALNGLNKSKLLASGDFTPADIAKMSDSEIQKALNGLNKEAPNAIDSVLYIIGEYIDTNMNAGIDLAVNLGMTIASGAALLYGSGGTSGTPTANSG